VVILNFFSFTDSLTIAIGQAAVIALTCGVVRCLLLLLLCVQYTPLLPAVAVGTMEERSIVEPVRNLVLGKVRPEQNCYNFVAAGWGTDVLP
jgi:hypothetical protein